MADPPRRVNFSHGQMLSVDDLVTEQHYHRSMRYLHNQLHGYGTVSGLEVDARDGQVRVTPGMAIDVLGREIVVTDELALDLGAYDGDVSEVRDLVILWREVPADPVPGVDGAAVFTRWVEQPELALVPTSTAPSEGLVLARLAWTSEGALEVDTAVRRALRPE